MYLRTLRRYFYLPPRLELKYFEYFFFGISRYLLSFLLEFLFCCVIAHTPRLSR